MIVAFGLVAILLVVLCGALTAIGLLRLYVWSLDRDSSNADSAYRAARLVAVSRAEVLRG